MAVQDLNEARPVEMEHDARTVASDAEAQLVLVPARARARAFACVAMRLCVLTRAPSL